MTPPHTSLMFPVMAGLVPAIHEREAQGMKGGWVYIVTNRPNGTLYLGVTANLARRIHEHREKVFKGFARRYGLKRLVWFEFHDDITTAIQRETTMKHWSRTWKVRLILEMNPAWADLYDTLG